MITAEQALQKIQKRKQESNNSFDKGEIIPINTISIEEIEKRINESIALGFTEIGIPNKPSEEVIDTLKTHGYYCYLFKHDCTDFVRNFDVNSKRPHIQLIKKVKYTTEICMCPKECSLAYEIL